MALFSRDGGGLKRRHPGEFPLSRRWPGQFQGELPSAIELDWLGLKVPVLSLESLIKSKHAVRRPKGLAHLPLLEQTLRAQRRVKD